MKTLLDRMQNMGYDTYDDFVNNLTNQTEVFHLLSPFLAGGETAFGMMLFRRRHFLKVTFSQTVRFFWRGASLRERQRLIRFSLPFCRCVLRLFSCPSAQLFWLPFLLQPRPAVSVLSASFQAVPRWGR